MERFSISFVSLLVCLLFVVPAFAGGYAGVEFYPDGSLYPFAGRSIFDGKGKVDIWAVEACEVAMTAGPKVGPFALGIGGSMGSVGGNLEIIYANIDCGFGFDFGRIHWQSYNLYQKSLQDEVGNFMLSRNWISHSASPVGIVGHNKKYGDNDAAFFWGAFVEIGQMGIFSSNRLCAAMNVRDTDTMWGAWCIGF